MNLSLKDLWDNPQNRTPSVFTFYFEGGLEILLENREDYIAYKLGEFERL